MFFMQQWRRLQFWHVPLGKRGGLRVRYCVMLYSTRVSNAFVSAIMAAYLAVLGGMSSMRVQCILFIMCSLGVALYHSHRLTQLW